MAHLRPYLSHFLSQLAGAGVQKAVVAPGSRSTPLALLLHEMPNVEIHMALDERSAGYFALGMAKSSGTPVALLCTSGTAAANFVPAVVEAFLSRIPLVVLTADRPRELRDVGAAQTIDQVHLYGRHVKWFQDLPTPGAVDLNRHAAQVAARAVHIAMAHPRGPVHLNFPLREPLLPEPGPIAPALMGHIYAAHPAVSAEGLDEAAAWMSGAEHPVIALGPEAPPIAAAVLQALHGAGVPVLADPLSGNGREDGVLTGYDTFIRAGKPPFRPDLVVRLGAPMTSKAFHQWSQNAALILCDWPEGFREPHQLKSLIIEGDPAAALQSLAHRLAPRPGAWLASLEENEAWAWERTADLVSEAPSHFEGRFYAQLNELWAARAMPVLAASSMPIRDVDTFYRKGPLHFYANRGANGIDGLVSTAMGIAQQHGDVLAILGDLAFYHDMNGLLLAQQHGLNAFIVIINNAGGAIFSFLSQSTLPDPVFEELFGTPHQMDFSGAATVYGALFRRARDYAEFREHFLELRSKPGLRILEWITTPRRETAAFHQRLYHSKDEGSE